MTKRVFLHQKDGKPCRGVPDSSNAPLCIHSGTISCYTMTQNEALALGFELISMATNLDEETN